MFATKFWSNNITCSGSSSNLLFHDVALPSPAKKDQLVNLFLDNITPKAKTILQKKSRVRPSSKGIIKVETDENGEIQPLIYLPEVLV